MNNKLTNFVNDEVNNRGEKKPPKNKAFDLKLYKKNTINSLNEIEHFLNNLKNVSKIIHIKKILK